MIESQKYWKSAEDKLNANREPLLYCFCDVDFKPSLAERDTCVGAQEQLKYVLIGGPEGYTVPVKPAHNQSEQVQLKHTSLHLLPTNLSAPTTEERLLYHMP